MAVLRAFTDVARAGVSTSDFVVTTSLNGEARPDQTFSKAAYLSGVTQEIDLKSLPDTSTLNIGVKGKGKIYYTLALGYPVPADEAIARDQGIFVEVRPYDLLEYQKIQSEKDIEFEEYINGKKPFDTLRYPKEIREYLTPIESTQVGQLVTYEYRLILSETRDKVAFESYFPSGAEAVNTNLATESGRVKKHTFFEREEYRDDRYFASIERLTPGEYVGTYTVRMTHPGEYLVPPTRAFEFYTPEVFGQTTGWKMKVER